MGFLPACNAATGTSDTESALEVVTLGTTPALTHWLPLVAECADPIPNFGVYTKLLSDEALSDEPLDLTLRLGAPKTTDPYAAVMGWEELTLVGGPEIPVTALSLESVQAIFTGEVTNWADVPEAQLSGDAPNQSITVLSYPEGDSLRQAFSDIYLRSNGLASDLTLFSSFEGQEALFSAHPAALSYSLANQVPNDAIILPITDLGPAASQIYVLAITNSKPEGNLLQLLLCLQSKQ